MRTNKVDYIKDIISTDGRKLWWIFSKRYSLWEALIIKWFSCDLEIEWSKGTYILSIIKNNRVKIINNLNQIHKILEWLYSMVEVDFKSTKFEAEEF